MLTPCEVNFPAGSLHKESTRVTDLGHSDYKCVVCDLRFRLKVGRRVGDEIFFGAVVGKFS